jgi:MFS family permease
VTPRTGGMRSYLVVLSLPRALPLVASACVSRLASPMITLSLLVAVHATRGSFADGGGVLAAYAVALGTCTPVAGRLADKHGPGRLLGVMLCLHAAAYVLMLTALATGVWPTAGLVGMAALLGATAPPASAVTRSVWPALVPEERLRTAYALDSAITDAAFIAGPLIVTGLTVILSPVTVVAVPGLLVVTGVLMLLWVVPSGRRYNVPMGNSAHSSRPLADARLRVLLGSMAVGTYCYGGMLIAVAAWAAQAGRTNSTGLVTAAFAVGGLIGGLTYGAAMRTTGNRRRQLALFCLPAGIMTAVAAAAPTLLVLGLLIFVTGLVAGPRDVLNQSVLGELADPAHRAEAFAWVNTCMWSGLAAGTGITGQLVYFGGPTIGFLSCAVLQCAGAAMVWVVLSRVPGTEPAARPAWRAAR